MINVIVLLVTMAGIALTYVGSYYIALSIVGYASAFRRYGTATLLFIVVMAFFVIVYVTSGADLPPVIIQYIPISLW